MHPQAERIHGRQLSEQAFHWGSYHQVIQVPHNLVPDFDPPTKIETDYWSCPLSLVIAETERQKQKEHRKRQKKRINPEKRWKLPGRVRKRNSVRRLSNVGKIIFKKEMKESSPTWGKLSPYWIRHPLKPPCILGHLSVLSLTEARPRWAGYSPQTSACGEWDWKARPVDLSLWNAGSNQLKVNRVSSRCGWDEVWDVSVKWGFIRGIFHISWII